MEQKKKDVKRTSFIPPSVMERINQKRNTFQIKTPSVHTFVHRAPISFGTALNIFYVIGKGFITDENSSEERWREQAAEECKQWLKDRIQDLYDVHELILQEPDLTDEERKEICDNIEKDISYLEFIYTTAESVRENLAGLKKRSSKDIEFVMGLRDQRVKHLESQKHILSIPKLAGILGIAPAAVVASFNALITSVQKAADTVHMVLSASVPILFGGLAVVLNMLWDNHIERKKDDVQKIAERQREEIDNRKIEDTKKILSLAELRLVQQAAFNQYLEDLREIAPKEFVDLVEAQDYEKVGLIIEEAANLIETGHLLPSEESSEMERLERLAVELALRVNNQSVEIHKICSEYIARFCEEESKMTVSDGG